MPAQNEIAKSLNLLAGTSTFDAPAAANAWAGTTGFDLVGALNQKAGTTDFDLNGVCTKLLHATPKFSSYPTGFDAQLAMTLLAGTAGGSAQATEWIAVGNATVITITAGTTNTSRKWDVLSHRGTGLSATSTTGTQIKVTEGGLYYVEYSIKLATPFPTSTSPALIINNTRWTTHDTGNTPFNGFTACNTWALELGPFTFMVFSGNYMTTIQPGQAIVTPAIYAPAFTSGNMKITVHGFNVVVNKIQ